jgi:hypothetical protein
MNTATTRQSTYKSTAISALFATSVVLLLLSISSNYSVFRSRAAGNSQPTAADAQMTEDEEHVVNIPYFVESEDFHSVLTLNNNKNEKNTAVVTIFNTKGEALSLPPIDLEPMTVARYQMRELLGDARGNFKEGNLQIQHHGFGLGVTSQVSVVSSNQRLSFESIEAAAKDFATTRLDGIVWAPDDETETRVALTNTASTPIQVTLIAGSQRKYLSLTPRETEVVDLREFVGEMGDKNLSTLVTLEHDGAPGALIATGFALNRRTGFSSNLTFADCGVTQSTKLAGAHIRFGQANPGEGFPSGTTFRAPLLIANTMDMPTTARVSVEYTIGTEARRVQLKAVTLASREVKVIELSQQMARQGVTGPVDEAGVDISYTEMPGAVIGHLTSYDRSGDYSFDVPIKDPLTGRGRGNGSYPWRLDNGYTTVIHLKNTTDQEVIAIYKVSYKGGEYNPDRIKLGPYQTVAIDLKRLRDAQQKDMRGAVMPKDVVSGQISWSEHEFQSLIGRAEVKNVRGGIASSFSCGSCDTCGSLIVYSSGAMNPGSAAGLAGGNGFMLAPTETDRNTCNGTYYGPYTVSSQYYSGWFSNASSVATVDSSGNESCVSPGSATITANWQAIVAHGSSSGPCTPDWANAGNGSGTCYTITISQNTPLWYFGFLNPAPSGFTLGDTSATLTANGASTGTFQWTITNGTDKLYFSELSPNGPFTITKTDTNTISISSQSYSRQANDVTVQLQYTPPGATQPLTANWNLSIDTPYTLVSNGTISNRGVTQNCTLSAPNGTDGFQTLIPYRIRSFFGVDVTNVYIVEGFHGSSVVFPNNDWPFPAAGSALLSAGTFVDNICVVNATTPPSLPPQTPLSSVQVDTLFQDWYVGGNNIAAGVRVQSDSLNRFQDHGTHTDIVSPNP